MAVCDCDILNFPVPLDIAPGLSRLPRQIGLFGNFRLAMLTNVRDHEALIEWRARDEEDFGLMILDWWSYVADVISFYTGEHTNELFVGTANVEENIRRIVQLIGYRPRPATAASATLAAIVSGTDVVTAPSGARFMSEAFDDQPPQEFETDMDTQLDPRLNEFTIAPIFSGLYDPTRLIIDPATRNIVDGGIAIIDVAGVREVIRVNSIEPLIALDGKKYLKLIVEEDPTPAVSVEISDVSLWSFAQSVPVADITATTVTLDGYLAQLRVGNIVVLEESETNLSRHTVNSIVYGRRDIVPSSDPLVPAITTATTVLTLSSTVSASAEQSVLHFGRLRGGRLVSPAKHELALTDLGSSAAIVGVHDSATISPGEVLLKGVRNQGTKLTSLLQIDADSGETTLIPDGSAQPFKSSLRTPVKVYANLLNVTRGKTVSETLGSGQGAVAFQTFTLAKKPLTYTSDPTAARGRRSSLRIWIDNIEWREVDSLFLAGSEERVFTVDLDAEGSATVTFGGNGYGLPAALGVQNVVAQYRFGAGSSPPENTIRQVAGPIPGLTRVFNVTPAYGGGAGDSPEDVRFLAPASSATFDRAVSAADFAALSRDFGAMNAVAVTEWVPDKVREGVVVTAIFEGEVTLELINSLEQHLHARAAEATPIRVIAADPLALSLALSYIVADDVDFVRVGEDIEFQLLDEFRGFLAPRNAQIGGPLFRAAILAAAAKVQGVEKIVSLLLNSVTCPNTIPLAAHEYFVPTLELTEVVA